MEPAGDRAATGDTTAAAGSTFSDDGRSVTGFCSGSGARCGSGWYTGSGSGSGARSGSGAGSGASGEARPDVLLHTHGSELSAIKHKV